MNKPTDQQIEDCRRRGMIEGTKVRCASSGSTFTVGPLSDWGKNESGITCSGYYLRYADEYATVITPAPNHSVVKNSVGLLAIPTAPKPAMLTPGMACIIPSPAGRQWIKELAEAKGLWCNSKFDREMDSLGEKAHTIAMYKAPDISANTVGLLLGDYSRYCYVPLHEFIRLLMEYEPPVPPKTTEELLKEALKHVDRLANIGASHWIGAQREARAFLKSIKP